MMLKLCHLNKQTKFLAPQKAVSAKDEAMLTATL